MFPVPGRALKWLLALGLTLAALVSTRASHAYPWMIRHGYQQCTPCHADPAGSGLLTTYGRLIGEDPLRTRYALEGDLEGVGAGRFLWGVELPNEVMLGGDVRALAYRQKVEGAAAFDDAFLMQSDLEAALRIGGLAASASIGYAHQGALAASLTRGTEDNLLSRQHWLGYWFGDWGLLRAGRMNLPFGIRNVEHTLWVREYTRTSINDHQQFGLSFAYQSTPVRAELMAIAGNLQLRPDDFRERGYSLSVEYFPLQALAVGASSLATYRELDPRLLRETWRHAHGVFSRYATPWQPLVLLTEWNYSFESPRDDRHRKGFVGFLQADLEVARGVHLLGTGEAHNVGVGGPEASYGGWLSYQWFFAPHADLRLDGVFQSLGTVLYRTEVLTFMAQVHVYL